MTDLFDRQYQREKQLSQQAYERATQLFLEQAANGNGGSATAAAWIVGKYLPLADAGYKALKESSNGQFSKILSGFEDLGPRLVIAVTIEGVLDALLIKPEQTRTYVLSGIADRLDRESTIGSFTTNNPLRAAQLHKRASREGAGARKKLRMFLTASEATGDPVLRIDKVYGVQLAGIALGLLIGAGMVEQHTRPGNAKVYLNLSAECVEELVKRQKHAAEGHGIHSPMLHPPVDWTLSGTGGYLTPEMREVSRIVLGPPSLSKRLPRHSSQAPLDALNLLQKTPWRVNRRVLEVVQAMAAAGELGEVVPGISINIPEYPKHLAGLKPGERTEAQQEEHQMWVDTAREAHTLRNKQVAASYRFVRVLEEAKSLKGEEAFYFVWAFDSRGRMYPRTYGMSPQGSDLQKALLEFRDGCWIENDRQLLLFQTNLAHRWGFDKASYADTRAWVEQNTPMILAHASDPLTNREWAKADSPFLYLAAAMEYKDYLEDPECFRSHIPIAADGACSGSQHMAAILRDPVTAQAVNLTPSDTRHDLYQVTGNKTLELLQEAEAAGELPEVLKPFLAFGIPRAMVKRPTMTLPYGLTQRSVAGYLFLDYLAYTDVPGLAEQDKFKAAIKLTPYVWKALGQVQSATMDALQWFRGAIKERFEYQPEATQSWLTPDGLLAQQHAVDFEESRIRTWCGSPISIQWQGQGITPSKSRHRTGFPPNFIHSLDATHLREVVRRMAALGCHQFAMIHDDFGVPVNWADKLWDVVREAFRDQYSGNLMAALKDQWGLALEPLEQRGWDVNEVLTAQFAFK